jgi:FixJ family two-component response regulator
MGPTIVRVFAEVVLVEDDVAMRSAIERILRGAGHVVRSFDSAEALLETLEGAPLWDAVDCGICDVRLPGACGFELQRMLATRRPTPPWIFITAHDDSAMRDYAGRARAAYLPKPFDGRTLLGLVRQALSGHGADVSQGATRATPRAN